MTNIVSPGAIADPHQRPDRAMPPLDRAEAAARYLTGGRHHG